jgi:hypothetical protein
MAPGVWDGSTLQPVNTAQIAEDARHAWLADAGAAPASLGGPDPAADGQARGLHLEQGAPAGRPGAGNRRHGPPAGRAASPWCARCGNAPAAMWHTGAVPRHRTGAAGAVWPSSACALLYPMRLCSNDAQLPDEADAFGLCEAARGSLGHWLSIREGRIANYQIIAPTSWNFSPRDRQGTPGALEAGTGRCAGAAGRQNPGVGAAHRAFF